MRFKVGDKVLIRRQGVLGSLDIPWNRNGKMDSYDGHIGQIVDCREGVDDLAIYHLDVDDGEWSWGEDCLKAVSPNLPVVGSVGILRIIIKGLETKIEWSTGEETSVKCHVQDDFDPEKGIALAIMKYVLGNTSSYNNIFHTLHEEQKKQKEEAVAIAMEEALKLFRQILGELDEDHCN